MAGSQKPKHVGTTGGAWQTAGCSAIVQAQGPGGRGTMATSKDRTSPQANKARCCGLEQDTWSPGVAEKEWGRQLPQRVIYWHDPVPCPELGSVTSSYLILIREETKLQVNALEKPLSWDSNPDPSGSDTHAQSSIQASI